MKEAGGQRHFNYTLIATAKLNDIDPQACLAAIMLARSPDHSIIPPSASTNSLPGTGVSAASLLKPPEA
jgi:hypothetical protein